MTENTNNKKSLDNLLTIWDELNRFYTRKHMDNSFKILITILFILPFTILFYYYFYNFLIKIPKFGLCTIVLLVLLVVNIISIKTYTSYILPGLTFVVYLIFFYCVKLSVLINYWGIITDLILFLTFFIMIILVFLEYRYIVSKKIKNDKGIVVSFISSCKVFWVRLKNKTFLEGVNKLSKINLIDELENKFLARMKNTYKLKIAEKEKLTQEVSKEYDLNKEKINKIILGGIIIGIGSIIVNVFNKYFDVLFSTYKDLSNEQRMNMHIILINWLTFLGVIILLILVYNFYIKETLVLTKNDKISIMKHCLENLETED